jgi:hypothetical protein
VEDINAVLGADYHGKFCLGTFTEYNAPATKYAPSNYMKDTIKQFRSDGRH